MECDLCTELFDGAERLPKSLPCGHTACLQCLGLLPDNSCPTCRRELNGPPEGLPTNFIVLKLLEGRRLDSTPRDWCSDCRAAATARCCEDHDVLSVRSALRRQLQDALPLAAEQLQGLQGQCRDEQVLPALTLLTGESWDVSLRGGGRELTGTLRNTEEPLTKALWLLLAERAALTEDRRDPPPAAAPAPSAAAPTQRPPLAAAPITSEGALAQNPPPAAAAAPTPTQVPPPAAAAAPTPTQVPPPAAAAAPTPTQVPPPAAAAAPTPTQGPPPAEARPVREMDVGDISWSKPNDMKQEKTAALEDAPGVRRLVDVRCHRDPAWSLELLQRAAPSLEELSVHHPGEAHLLAVHAMPRLRRLHVTGSPDARLPTVLMPRRAGLQWLSVWGLSRDTLDSLLKAHGDSLEEVQLTLGAIQPGRSAMYPYGDYDRRLHSLLQSAGLRAMRKLVLKRRFVHHDADACVLQRASARPLLGGAEVLCDQCDGVAGEEL